MWTKLTEKEMFAGYSVNKCMWNGSDVYNKC
jgi:hypothetical protein